LVHASVSSGNVDPRPTRYWEGAGDYNARMRRFLGFFAFSCKLPEGDSPGIRAAKALYRFSNREETLQAVSGARYLMALVSGVVSGQGIWLELEDERFEIRDRRWSRLLSVGDAVVAHLVPTGRRGQWLPGPGWLGDGGAHAGSGQKIYLLFRLLPEFRSEFRYADETRFIEKYGVWEMTYTRTQDYAGAGSEDLNAETGVVSKRGGERMMRREKPGMSPALLLHVIECSAFLRLEPGLQPSALLQQAK